MAVRVRSILTFAKLFLFLSGLFRSSRFSGSFDRFEIVLGTLLHLQIIFPVPVFPLLSGPCYVSFSYGVSACAAVMHKTVPVPAKLRVNAKVSSDAFIFEPLENHGATYTSNASECVTGGSWEKRSAPASPKRKIITRK
jgi:hypothetical protein